MSHLERIVKLYRYCPWCEQAYYKPFIKYMCCRRFAVVLERQQATLPQALPIMNC